MEKALEVKKRIPRNRRVKEAPSMVLTERDKKVILLVYENRFLRRDQIQKLFFPSTQTCNQRLMKLYQHRFLERIFKPVSFGQSQAVYALDKRGKDIVARELGLENIKWSKSKNRVELFFLEHTLAVNDFKVNLLLFLRERRDVKLLFFKHEWEDLKDRVSDPRGKRPYLPVTPDAFFGIETERGKAYFFLEADRGTQTLKRFREKIVAYRQYWKEGKYQERHGFKNFRVLTVTTSKKRLLNLLSLAEKEGARTMFLFTTEDCITSDFLSSPIWLAPIENGFVSLI
jgi:hypothetical protein